MERMVVRQPVFDKDQNVFGYKILCFSERPDTLESLDHTNTSLSEIENAFLVIGFNRITGGKRAFVDLTNSLLAGETQIALPNELTVAEISYRDEAKSMLLQSCRKLKEAGYALAADADILKHEDALPLMDLVDIFKSQVREDDPWPSALRERLSARGKKFLAEGVNSREEFHLALGSGCDYFQGYFFSEPVIITGKDIPGYELTQLRILNEVNQPDVDYAALEKAIKQDVSVSYKLLKFINSAYFGLRREVSSIKQALALLGEREIRRWASLVVMTGLGKNKPAELVVASLIRANFCEYLAARIGLKDKASEIFLMGLFSMLDTFIGRPIEEIVAEMPLAEDIKSALSGKRNKCRRLLDLVVSYERGDVKPFLALASKLNVKEGTITDLYLHSIDRAEDALQLYGPEKTSAL